MSSNCVICDSPEGTLSKVTPKGLKTLIKFAKLRVDKVLELLENSQEKTLTVFVHEGCRKYFTDKRKLNLIKQPTRTRNTSEKFEFTKDCLFCAKPCKYDYRHPGRKSWVTASTVSVKNAIVSTCNTILEKDPDDEWALKVKTRTDLCIDLVAAKARYHPLCRLKFRNHEMSKRKVIAKKGRQSNIRHRKAFLESCSWLEGELTVHSLKDFTEKVQEILGNEKVYKTQYVKVLLKRHNGTFHSQRKNTNHQQYICSTWQSILLNQVILWVNKIHNFFLKQLQC